LLAIPGLLVAGVIAHYFLQFSRQRQWCASKTPGEQKLEKMPSAFLKVLAQETEWLSARRAKRGRRLFHPVILH